ncbi:MAG TPA: monovalent cation:proton antiporter-2 (CPA2) family protein [Longimicrobiales bacterium]|nr:monovalent cation:proton antiporter-2 (CPA2) family protein [Longimicrobiales bacterium]
MSLDAFLTQAFVYLAAAVVSVPLAKRLGLGSVLGYLLAGVLIGPFVLGFVGTEGQDVMHFAEFGVVMMLFVIGLELEPALLWRLRGPILGMGGLQVLLSTLALAGAALALGLPASQALAVGMILALSSTAIVLQTLGEKGQLETAGGRSAFSVLLFQDVAVIPILALIPLLASGVIQEGGHGSEGGHETAATLLSGLPAWVQALAVLGAVAAIILGGRTVVRPAFRAIARTRSQEIFTAAALLLVIGTALLMKQVGLSPALGTFLAGVVLANSEFRHELETDLEPFKGLLLGLFFISVGASMDFGLVARQPGLIAGVAGGAILLKFLILLGLARAFRLRTDQALLFALALPQMGEFGFVLLSFAGQEGVLGASVSGPLTAAIAVSMAVTPLLLAVNDRLVQPRLGTRRAPEREPDVIQERGTVLIAGFGAFGTTVGRLLRAKKVRTTVLEFDSDRVDLLRQMGLEVYYGDATRKELLEAAGAHHASLLVVALPDPETTMRLVRTARTHFPHLTILARAFDWTDAHDLMSEDVEHVYRDTLDTALRAGRDALTELGFRAHQAHRATQTFRRHDQESLRTLFRFRSDRSGYIGEARQRIQDLEQVLRLDMEEPDPSLEAGWDPESLRNEYGERGEQPG